MPVEQITLIPCLRELKTLRPWQKRRAASKNVDQGTKRHAGSPVLTKELWDEQVPSGLDLGDLCGWGNDAVTHLNLQEGSREPFRRPWTKPRAAIQPLVVLHVLE